jgi:tRNA pseudouridine55 synthase
MNVGVDAARAMAGALLIDKPPGPTSHDVVAVVRRALRTSQVGHTGTLDPLATGLLVVLVGGATRLARFLAADEKEYIADVRLGVSTPTYDAAALADGVRCPVSDVRYPMADVETVLERFRGSYQQTPPPYSAKKVGGVAAYEKARRNQPVDLKPVLVTVRDLRVLDSSEIGHRTSDVGTRDLLRLRVAASAGFYVRSLAHDIGQALGCGAHLEGLRRTRVGRFRVEDGLTLDRLEVDGVAALVPVNVLLGEMPSVAVTADGERRAAHGNPVSWDHVEKGDSPLFPPPEKGAVPFFRLLDVSGTLIAVAEPRPDGLLHPVVVLR